MQKKARLKPGADIEAGIIVPKSLVVKTVLLPSRLDLNMTFYDLSQTGP